MPRLRLCLSAAATLLLVVALAAPSAAAGGALPRFGWAVGSDGPTTPVILHTPNGGHTWRRQDSGLPRAPLYSVAAVDAWCAWAVGGVEGGYPVILRTTDRGRSWTRQGGPGLPAVELYGVAAVDRDTAWAVGGKGVILHTDDGGQSWVRQGAGQVAEVELTDAYAADRHSVWVVGDQLGEMGAIYRTGDGGANWSRQAYTPRQDVVERYLLACQGLGELHVWIVGRGTALVTRDGGRTWTDVTPEGFRVAYDINGVAVAGRGRVWVVTDNDGIFHYDGLAWRQQTPPVFGHYLLGAAAADEDSAWAVGQRDNFSASWGVILGTDNAGHTWDDQYPDLDLALTDVSFVRLPVE
jgi:photosystem II stability/assembly factor-like uncharacterized protein